MFHIGRSRISLHVMPKLLQTITEAGSLFEAFTSLRGGRIVTGLHMGDMFDKSTFYI